MAEILQDATGKGFIYGILLMVALSIFMFWFNVWMKSIKSVFKPQPVILTTKKSPFGVMVEAILQTILFVAGIAFIASVAYIYYFL